MRRKKSDNTAWDVLWFNAKIATMREGLKPFGLIKEDAIAIKNGKICWIGKCSDIDHDDLLKCRDVHDCQGKLITPGLIDCHTHIVYGGNRVDEFEMRLNGVSYADISKAGGGIASTVNATRSCSEAELYDLAEARLQDFINEGVTTVEIKSGYGLNLESEIKMLSVARELERQLPIDVVSSFLGAHATPAEFSGDNDAYIDHICHTIIPAVATQNLADSVDAFCENIAFTVAQVERVFLKAKEHNLSIKLHAEQLSDQQGAVMAAKMGALSVDHIEYLANEDVKTLADNGTVAVLLPGAFYFLGETKLPPISELRRLQVPIAIASDSNPGSSPVSSLLLMLNMACTLFKLTPEESLAGVTRNAAKALGIESQVGTLELGKVANIVLWNSDKPAELCYKIGHNPCNKVMYRGVCHD